MNARCLFCYSLLATNVILLSGCATSTLWQTGQFVNYHEPATPANLRLYKSGDSQDVLVVYDESRENNDGITRRAYWLEPNSDRVRERQKPHFVKVKSEKDLVLIPVGDSGVSSSAATNAVCAVVSTNAQSFVLRSPKDEKGPYQLPVYADASGRTKQILLTPVTVAADLTIVGGYLFVFAWECGGLQAWLSR
jgi:hypothetical protein